jgi:hypothetical protein
MVALPYAWDGASMTEKQNPTVFEGLIKRLMAETGISEAQARELVQMLGAEWASLVREARMLRRPGMSKI